MRSVFICTTLVAVVSSVFSQRPFARYSENLKKGIPHHYNHDKEDTNRGVDKIARGHKIEPPLPPLRSHQAVPWLRWVHEGRWAAQVDKNTELHKVRTRLLEEKLKPNHFVFKPRISPQLKPKLNRKENARTKREVGKTEIQEVQKETGEKGYIRHKRDAMMPQLMPEMIMQPHIEVKMPKPPEQFKERPEEMERRGKRQILYFINGPPRELARAQITTPNPFIRDTHIEDYDIIRSEVGEREGMIPTIESGSSDLGSHPLMNEEATEFSKIINQFYLTTSDESWPEIQRFAENILIPLSRLMVKKRELNKALKSLEYVREKFRENAVNEHRTYSVKKDTDRVVHKRVKRRVNKTLKRKRAKKKKQRLRRFERKRLRMLTHARRVRRQQKSKLARLQRHYARMNMSSNVTHIGNQTLTGEVKNQDKDESSRRDESEAYDESKEEDEESKEEDEEYESSEYEDESEISQSKTRDKSKGKTSEDSKDESEKSDEEETEMSDIGSKPDYGNDDYEYESDEEYKDDDSSEESEKENKKGGTGKKLKAESKRTRKYTLQMLNRHKYNKQRGTLKNSVSNQNNFKGEKQSFFKGKSKENTKHVYSPQQNIFKNNKIFNHQKQPLITNI